jgi:anti-sigma-K factor RskA
MTALLNDPSVQSFALAGDAATGRFWVTSSGDVGCLVVQGLPELAAGQVYQVWLREGDQPVGVATFVTQAGNAWTLIRAEQPIQQFQAIGITIEPQGGSPAPTGQGVLFGELSPSVHGTPQVIAAR